MRLMASATLAFGLLASGCGADLASGSSPDTAPSTLESASAAAGATTTTRPGWLSPVTPATVMPPQAEVLALSGDLAIASWSVAGTNERRGQTQIAVADHGAKPGDERSDSAAFDAAVAAAASMDGPVTLILDSGTYRLTETLHLVDGVTLRGEGPATQVVVDFDDADGPAIAATGRAIGGWVPVGGELVRGATEVNILDASDAEAYRIGDMVEIEQTNDASMYTKPEWNVDWGEGSVGELNRVVSVDGQTLQLEAPINADYTPDLAPRIRRIDAVEQVGIEDLSLFREDEGYGSTIRFELVADAWVDGVVSRRTSRAHVGLNQVFRCRVEDSIFHDATDFGDGGRAYGVSLARHTTGCLVVDNTLYDLRHAIIVQLGASGNVVAYNHARGSAGYEDRQPRADLSLHGHWPQANLFEGNIVDRVVSSDWWGPSGPTNTLFRNCVRDHVIVADSSDDHVVIANVIGGGGFTVEEGIEGTFVAGNLVAGVQTGFVDAAESDGVDVPASLWTEQAPEFLDGYAWPPIDPSRDGSACDLPASERSPLGNG